MGVTLIVTTPRGKEIVLDPGWRSMMNSLLLDNGLMGHLDKEDIPLLREVGEVQLKGVREPPFDHSDQIKDAFDVIIGALEQHGAVTVSAHW